MRRTGLAAEPVLCFDIHHGQCVYSFRRCCIGPLWATQVLYCLVSLLGRRGHPNGVRFRHSQDRWLHARQPLSGPRRHFPFCLQLPACPCIPKVLRYLVALVTGAFDASAAVFLFYCEAYDASSGRISLTTFFFGYLTVPALMLVAEFTFMPTQAYYSAPELD